MRRRWFFGVSLTETARWTIAVIFLAVAVLATPMPMALYIAIAIISTLEVEARADVFLRRISRSRFSEPILLRPGLRL
jgi:hypothetical protein